MNISKIMCLRNDLNFSVRSLHGQPTKEEIMVRFILCFIFNQLYVEGILQFIEHFYDNSTAYSKLTQESENEYKND